MGAGRNDIAKATNVGSFSIAHVGSNIVLTYTLSSGYYLSATHFYYGATYPRRIAPGQFGNTHDPLALTTTDTFTVPYVPGHNTYIVHAAISVGC